MATSQPNSPMVVDHHSIISKKEQQCTINNLPTTEILNEQILSQKFDQLSPFVNNQMDTKSSSTHMLQSETVLYSTVMPAFRINEMDLETIPDYLSFQNQDFENKIHSLQSPTIKTEELREIAILMYKIITIDIVQSLWIVYRKSGIGDLPSTLPLNQYDNKIWPKEVQSLMKQQHQSQIPTYDNEHDNPCLTFVNSCLHDLQVKHAQYEHELNMKTNLLIGYTSALKCIIEEFVQQGLQSLRTEIDQQIALVQYDYMDSLLKRAYLAQNPNTNQMKIMKHLCKLKYDQEMTKHEMNLLKQQIPIYLASHPFEHESIAQSSSINNISDERIRAKLYQQYKDAAEQARTNMMTLYMESAQKQMQQCQKQFDLEMKQLWKTERTLPFEQQLTSIMQKLIDQQMINISARMECIYKFKFDLLRNKLNMK